MLLSEEAVEMKKKSLYEHGDGVTKPIIHDLCGGHKQYCHCPDVPQGIYQ